MPEYPQDVRQHAVPSPVPGKCQCGVSGRSRLRAAECHEQLVPAQTSPSFTTPQHASAERMVQERNLNRCLSCQDRRRCYPLLHLSVAVLAAARAMQRVLHPSLPGQRDKAYRPTDTACRISAACPVSATSDHKRQRLSSCDAPTRQRAAQAHAPAIRLRGCPCDGGTSPRESNPGW